MLDILNILEPIFEDNYKKIGVREYARLKKISPPHASKILNELANEGLLLKEEDRRYHFFSANRSNKTFIDLSRIYWYQKLKAVGFIDFLAHQFEKSVIVLSGTFASADVNKNSDIDVIVASSSARKIDLSAFEHQLSRKIKLSFKKDSDVSMLNGYMLMGNPK